MFKDFSDIDNRFHINNVVEYFYIKPNVEDCYKNYNDYFSCCQIVLNKLVEMNICSKSTCSGWYYSPSDDFSETLENTFEKELAIYKLQK